MSERKNIKRNKNRVSVEELKRSGRKGCTKLVLTFPEDAYLQRLVSMGLL